MIAVRLKAKKSLYLKSVNFRELNPSDFSISTVSKRIGRKVYPAEIACAAAHKEIYKEFLKSDIGIALILEDDAQLVSFERLNEVLNLSYILDQDDMFVVTLIELPNVPSNEVNLGFRESSLRKCAFSPSKTTAYLISKKAAQFLVQRQNPIKYLADWPASSKEIDFYMSSKPIFKEDPNLVSTISNNDRSPKLITRISFYTGIYYLRHHSVFYGFRDFLEFLVMPRIKFHINSLRLRKKMFK